MTGLSNSSQLIRISFNTSSCRYRYRTAYMDNGVYTCVRLRFRLHDLQRVQHSAGTTRITLLVADRCSLALFAAARAVAAVSISRGFFYHPRLPHTPYHTPHTLPFHLKTVPILTQG